MKTFEKVMHGMTITAWIAFVLSLLSIESNTCAPFLGLAFSAAWLITSAWVKEECREDKKAVNAYVFHWRSGR